VTPADDPIIATEDSVLPAALRLYRKLSQSYLDASGLYGPDEYPFTWEAGAIMQFYPLYRTLTGLGLLRYPRYRYVQGQAYWIIANLFLYKSLEESKYLDLAIATGRQLVNTQNPDGSWINPLPGWQDRISTVYCSWGGLALVKLYNATRDDEYLAAAVSWKECMLQKVGTCHTTLSDKDLELIQYFYPTETGACPNASTLALAFLSNLARHLTSSDQLLMRKLLSSIGKLQLTTGEIPYTEHRVHYQCQSYNAFEFVDLFEYARNSNSTEVIRILKGLADFLCKGVSQSGQVGYSCSNVYPEVLYHSLIVAAALHYASLLFGDRKYAAARHRIIDRIVRGSGLMPLYHGVSKFGPVKVKDRAFFARQTTYSLVSLLRIALIPRMEFLNGTLV
jgi:hypothetical protein